METPNSTVVWETWYLPDSDYEIIADNITDTWRHGTIHQTIIRRKSDDTFWMINYRQSTDGEYNEFRDNEKTFQRVTPVQRLTTDWELF